MATSGTYDWLPSVDVLIAEAWERCGKSPEILNSAVISAALRSLQLLLLHWQNLGPRLWTIERATMPCVIGQAAYTMPAATVDVLEVGIVNNGVEVPIVSLGRDEYAAIAVKTLQGPPSQYWTNRGLPLPVVTLYPVPDQAYTLWFNRIRQPQDVSALAQEPEIPALWADAVSAELARRLAVKFAPERLEVLTPDAQRAYQAARAESRERTPLTLSLRMR